MSAFLKGIPAVLLLVFAISACQSDEQGTSTDSATTAEMTQLGEQVYRTYCGTCHQADGQGIPGAFPPLAETEWVNGDKGRLIRLVLNGMQGPISVNGSEYNNMMTPHNFLSDEQVAAVLSYVRNNFGNKAEVVQTEEVTKVREATNKEGLWDASELESMTGIPD